MPTAAETPGQSSIIEPVSYESDKGYTPFIIAAAFLMGLGIITAAVIIISRRKRNAADTTLDKETNSP